VKLLNALHRADKKLQKKLEKSKEISDRYQKKVEALTVKSTSLIKSSISIQQKHVDFLQ